jgi:ketosteroid isomerase-like protein
MLAACRAGEPLPPADAPKPPSAELPAPRASIRELSPPPPPPAVTVAKPTLLELERASFAEMDRAFAAHDAKRLADLYAPDATIAELGIAERKGHAAILASFADWFAGVADLHLVPIRTYVKGNVCVHEWVLGGTLKGELFGIKATDKAVGVRGAAIQWFTGEGKIRREQRYFDASTVAAQVGRAKPPPGRAVPVVPASERVLVTAEPDKDDRPGHVGKALLAAWEKRSDADWMAQMSKDAVVSDTLLGVDRATRVDVKKVFDAYAAALPDARAFVDNVWVVGDTAISELRLAGVQKAALGPIAASKAPLALHAVDIVRARDGKAVEVTRYANGYEVLAARGLVPWLDRAAKAP